MRHFIENDMAPADLLPPTPAGMMLTKQRQPRWLRTAISAK